MLGTTGTDLSLRLGTKPALRQAVRLAGCKIGKKWECNFLHFSESDSQHVIGGLYGDPALTTLSVI